MTKKIIFQAPDCSFETKFLLVVKSFIEFSFNTTSFYKHMFCERIILVSTQTLGEQKRYQCCIHSILQEIENSFATPYLLCSGWSGISRGLMITCPGSSAHMPDCSKCISRLSGVPPRPLLFFLVCK